MDRAGIRGTALLVLLALVTAACSGSDGKSRSSTSPQSSTSTTAPTPTIDPKAAVTAAYLDYWAAVDAAFAAPEKPDDLERVATEPLLSFVRDDLANLAAHHQRYLTPDGRKSTHRIDRVSIEANPASLEDCYVDARVLYAADGSIIDDATISKTAKASLVRATDSWMVSDLVFSAKSDGSARCAA